MVGMGHIGFGTFWVWFGYGGAVAQAVVGGLLLTKQLASLAGWWPHRRETTSHWSRRAAAVRNVQILYLVLSRS